MPETIFWWVFTVASVFGFLISSATAADKANKASNRQSHP